MIFRIYLKATKNLAIWISAFEEDQHKSSVNKNSINANTLKKEENDNAQSNNKDMEDVAWKIEREIRHLRNTRKNLQLNFFRIT